MIDTNNVVLEHLRVIRADMGNLKEDMSAVRTEVREIKQHVAAFLSHEILQDGDIASIKARLDRIEKRLDLNDA